MSTPSNESLALMPLFGLGTFRLYTDTTAAVECALQHNYTHIDCASRYKNEKLVQAGIIQSGVARTKIFLTTKIWENTQQEVRAAAVTFGEIGYIDCVLLHKPSAQLATDYADILSVVAHEKIPIRNIGVSNFNVCDLEQIEHLPRPYYNQIEVTPFSYMARKPLIDKCRQMSIPIVAHTPLMRCELKDDIRLIEMAKKYNVSQAQLLLSWSRRHNFIPIPGSKNPEHIVENQQFVKISDDDMVAMDNWSTPTDFTVIHRHYLPK